MLNLMLSMKFIMLINVNMSTAVVILTFNITIRVSTTSERLKARRIFIFQHFSFYEQLKFHSELSLSVYIVRGY